MQELASRQIHALNNSKHMIALQLLLAGKLN